MTLRVLAFALTSGLTLGATTALAQGQEGDERVDTVRYSYTKWSRGGQPRYVLVPAPASVKPGKLPERIRELFAELVRDKRNTYGDARLAFKDDAEASGVVFVYLDATKAQYNPIVMSETVYTFTENGASRVIFPKVAEQGWTRDDVPFPGYALSVPLWQALPPGRLGAALVQLPDGSLLRSEEAHARLEKGDAALVNAMWSYVEKGPAPAALAAVVGARELKLKDLEARLLPVLQSADTALRGAALDGLEGRDTGAVNEALRKVMDGDPDAALKDRAAALLSKSKDPKYAIAAQYHALRSSNPEVVIAAAGGLADSKQPEARARLIDTLGHADAKVRAAVIAALLKRGDHDAVVSALADGKIPAEARIEAARALATGDQRKAAHAALMHLAVNGQGDDSAGAAAKLAEHDDAATYEALGKAVKHAEAATRRAAASALGRLKNTKGLDLLAAANVEDAETGEALMTAIRAIYAAQELDYVLKATRQQNPVLKRAAVATLGAMVELPQGKRFRKTIVETLQPLAGASDPNIRAAAARSFEAMASKEVEADLFKLAEDGAVEVKRAVAHALRAFPGEQATKALLGYLKATDAAVLANAAETAGLLKAREALDPVIALLNHDEVRVRRAATGALVELGSTLEQRKPLLSFFSERLFDKDPDVRLKAVQGLKLVQDPRTVTAMAALLQDPVADIRKATLLAMAATGDKSAVEAIGSALEDEDPQVRRTAIEALQALKHKEASKLLNDYAGKEKDAALAEEARKAARALQGG